MNDRPHLDRIYIRDLLQRCVIGIYDEAAAGKAGRMITITLHADLRKAGQTDLRP